MQSKSVFRRTKIVCTIGPETESYERLKQLILAGMDVARLNFSHGDREAHRKTIRNLRRAADEVGKDIGILQDLAGPKMRLGTLIPDKRTLRKGDEIALFSASSSSNELIPVNYPGLMEDINTGDRVLLADGTVQLSVREKTTDRVICEVIVGGTISSHKGINFPSTHLKISAFTEKDSLDLKVGLEEGVDFVAMSFVRTRSDVEPVLEILNRIDHRPLLIAKIEKPQAVDDYENILGAVDGVMVARGDLGVEMPPEEVPIIQKRLVRLARQAGKPVITATQMLTSMQDNPLPTRAEATDVANAVLDGTDALMLSEETAVGSYPLEAVSMLDRIARSTEPHIAADAFLDQPTPDLLPQTAAAISRAACLLARDLHAAAIVATSSSGSTARLVARYRPPRCIIALTDHIVTKRQLSISWGVIPYLVDAFLDTDQMFGSARTWALEQGLAKEKDLLIITAGVPVGVSGTTNLLKVMEVC